VSFSLQKLQLPYCFDNCRFTRPHPNLTADAACVAAAVQCDPECANNMYESESVQSDRLESKVERVHLEWQGLTCSYNGSHGKIVVLQDVWGAALAGEMQVRTCHSLQLDPVCWGSNMCSAPAATCAPAWCSSYATLASSPAAAAEQLQPRLSL
jgi:hypothetical protein